MFLRHNFSDDFSASNCWSMTEIFEGINVVVKPIQNLGVFNILDPFVFISSGYRYYNMAFDEKLVGPI